MLKSKTAGTKELVSKIADGVLVRAAVKGDRLAWNELIRRYDGVVRQEVGSLFFRADFPFTHADIDDLMGDFYLRLLDNKSRRLRAYAARQCTVKTWFKRIARQAAIDHLRHEGRAITKVDDYDPDLEPRGGRWIATEREW